MYKALTLLAISVIGNPKAGMNYQAANQLKGHARRHERGLALFEVMAGGLVIATFLLGLTSAWHVMDYQFLVSRLQGRLERVIRQANDFILYAPYDALPTDGQQILGGYLFEPFDQQSQSYKHELPYSFNAAVTASNTGTINDQKQIQLTFTYILPNPKGHETRNYQIQLQSISRSRY
jgi:hypothetical protein